MVKLWFRGFLGLLVALSAFMPMPGGALHEDEPVDFVFTNGEGEDITLADYEGKIAILAFFTDCEAIGRAQALRLERGIWRQYVHAGIELIGIVEKGSRPEVVQDFVESAELSYPVLRDTRNTRAFRCPDSSALLTMVIDQRMRLRQEVSGSAFGELVTVVNSLRATTDIDESTWGKIKELFK